MNEFEKGVAFGAMFTVVLLVVSSIFSFVCSDKFSSGQYVKIEYKNTSEEFCTNIVEKIQMFLKDPYMRKEESRSRCFYTLKLYDNGLQKPVK